MKRVIFVTLITAVVFNVVWGSLESLNILFSKNQLITIPAFLEILSSVVIIYGLWGIIIGGLNGGLFFFISYLKKRSFEQKKLSESALFVSLFILIFFYSLLRLRQSLHISSKTEVILYALGIAAGLTFLVYFLWCLFSKWISIGRKEKLILSGFYILTMTLSTIFGTSNIEPRINNNDVLKFSPEEEKPNILLITIDTLRSDYLGCYGNPVVKTPHIDQVAKEGVLFSQAITHIPITGPSHTSLMTSLLPRTHEVKINGIPYQKENITLAELMRSHGYRTAAFVSAYPLKSYNSGLHRGFDMYNDSFSYLDSHEALLLVQFFNHLGLLYGGLEQRAEETNKKALRWLEDNYGKPFFLWIHYFDPHYPYDPLPPYDTFYQDKKGITKNDRQKALYAGEISYTDEHIGKLINQLKKLKVLDDTLLIITADHGEGLGEHDYYYDHSEYLYEPLIKIPLIMRYPPLLPKNKIIEKQVQIIDIMPTVISIAGIHTNHQLFGRNLLSLMNENFVELKALTYALVETFEPEASTDRTAIRTNEWKLIVNSEGQEEFYNLIDDPDELVNLNNKESVIKQEFNEKLRGIISSIPQSEDNVTASDIDQERLKKLKSLGYLQ
jgi:arylsulfatase A-like enzyme